MTNSRPPRRPRGRSGSSKKAVGQRAEELHPVDEVPDIKSFRELALAEDIQEAIAAMGITEPTPIQKLAIAPVLEGRDVIAKAETGTGKTLAFGAPMMSRIEADRASVLGLILCPTRELALQVYEVIVELGQPRGIKVALVVGGDPMHPQVDALRNGAQVVVGTPGRVLDLAKQRFLSFPWTEFAVLDEADEMLEIGFIDDVRKILDMCSEDRQTLLFSATFPPELLRLARDHTKNPVEVATAKGVASVENITHYVTQVGEHDRDATLKRLIHATAQDDVLLVFCDRRVEVERVLRTLERTRLNVKALHGGYDQAARTRVMSAFRDGSVKVLVATDVASRGLDIKHVTHVINLSVPRSISAYTHRSGRTGRAGRAGAALTVVVPSDKRRWRELESQMTWPVIDFDERQRNAAKDAESAEPKRRERTRSRRDAGDDGEKRESRPRRRERSRRSSAEPEAREVSETREERPRRAERSRRSRELPQEPSETTARESRPRRSERSRRPRAESEASSESSQREARPRRRERSRRPAVESEAPSEPARETRPRRSQRSQRPKEDSEPRFKMPERQTRRSEHERRHREMENATAEQNSQQRESSPRQSSNSDGRSERPRRARRSKRTSESRGSQSRSSETQERSPRQRGDGDARTENSNSQRKAPQRPRSSRRSDSKSNSNETQHPPTPSKPESSGGGFGAGL